MIPGQPLTELDKQVMYWEGKGKLVPTRDLIKTAEQIEGIRKAGVVNTGVLDEVAAKIHAGMSTLEIDEIVHNFTIAHGATPAPLNYEGFPKSVCTSINEVVCHGIPKAWIAPPVWTDTMLMPPGCSSLVRLPQRRNSWCVWPRSVWRLVPRPRSLIAL